MVKKKNKEDKKYGYWSIDSKRYENAFIIGDNLLVSLIIGIIILIILLNITYNAKGSLKIEVDNLNSEISVLRDFNDIDFNITISNEFKIFDKECSEIGGDGWWSNSGYRTCTIYNYNEKQIIILTKFCRLKKIADDIVINKGSIICR